MPIIPENLCGAHLQDFADTRLIPAHEAWRGCSVAERQATVQSRVSLFPLIADGTDASIHRRAVLTVE